MALSVNDTRTYLNKEAAQGWSYTTFTDAAETNILTGPGILRAVFANEEDAATDLQITGYNHPTSTDAGVRIFRFNVPNGTEFNGVDFGPFGLKLDTGLNLTATSDLANASTTIVYRPCRSSDFGYKWAQGNTDSNGIAGACRLMGAYSGGNTGVARVCNIFNAATATGSDFIELRTAAAGDAYVNFGPQGIRFDTGLSVEIEGAGVLTEAWTVWYLEE